MPRPSSCNVAIAGKRTHGRWRSKPSGFLFLGSMFWRSTWKSHLKKAVGWCPRLFRWTHGEVFDLAYERDASRNERPGVAYSSAARAIVCGRKARARTNLTVLDAYRLPTQMPCVARRARWTGVATKDIAVAFSSAWRKTWIVHRRRADIRSEECLRFRGGMMNRLKLGIPKGSLPRCDIGAFCACGWKITLARELRAHDDDPEIECLLLRAGDGALVETGR